MAAVVRERSAPPPPPPTSAPPPPPAEPRLSSALEAGAEIAVVLMTAAAAISLLRLFTDGSFLDRVLLAVVAAHAPSVRTNIDNSRAGQLRSRR